jgi:TPR repeat protein
VPKSPQIALKWFRNAAELDHRGATLALVEMYENGEGTDVNRPEAYYWLYMAYREGMDDAKQRAAELWKQMQADDIKHVEKKLRSRYLDPKRVFKEMGTE